MLVSCSSSGKEEGSDGRPPDTERPPSPLPGAGVTGAALPFALFAPAVLTVVVGARLGYAAAGEYAVVEAGDAVVYCPCDVPYEGS